MRGARSGLRNWYHHAPDLFEEFSRRYTAELDDPEPAAALAHLKDLAAQQTLTLLTATKHPDISEAAVLVKVLTRGAASLLVAGEPAAGVSRDDEVSSVPDFDE